MCENVANPVEFQLCPGKNIKINDVSTLKVFFVSAKILFFSLLPFDRGIKAQKKVA